MKKDQCFLEVKLRLEYLITLIGVLKSEIYEYEKDSEKISSVIDGIVSEAESIRYHLKKARTL